MLNRLKNFLTTPAAPAAKESTGSAAEPHVDPYMLGLKDAALSGWFDQQNGELYRGFPVGPEDTVLDVGCGNGGNVHFCAMRGARIIVADIDAEKIEATRQRLEGSAARSVECLVTDSAPLPIPDASVSRVVSTEVIEHVDDPQAFLAELVRVGQPGALYLLSAPHPSSEELQRGFAADDYFRKPNHVRVIGEQQFRDWVTEAGLEVVSHGQYGFYWSLWMLFFWEAGVGFENPDHPLLHNWTRTWDVLLDSPRGAAIKEVLDQVVAKSQVIVARKP